MTLPAGRQILAPLLKKDEDGNRTPYGFKAVRVYDHSQTDGRDLPKFDSVHGDPKNFLSRLVRFAGEHQIEVDFSDLLPGADGVSVRGRVIIGNDLPDGEKFAVLAHELAHEVMHRGERKVSKQTKELEAEAVAFVTCSVLGLDTFNRSRDYLGLYDGDDKALADSLQMIQRTVKLLLAAII